MKAYVNIVESAIAFVMMVGFITWIFTATPIAPSDENMIKFERASTALTTLFRSGVMDAHFLEGDIDAVSNWMNDNLAPLKTGIRVTYVKEGVELANTTATLDIMENHDKIILILLNPSSTTCEVSASSTISFTFSDIAVVDLSNETSGLASIKVTCDNPTWAILRTEREYASEAYHEVLTKEENVVRIFVPYEVNPNVMGEMELVVS